MIYFSTKDLAVGYNGRALIHDINIAVEKGSIMTLIGPNGAGKSTILKSITRHISKLYGEVYIDKNEIAEYSAKEMAKKVAVVLTDRINPDLMTCWEVVAMGRYPYTNALGHLTQQDKEIVDEAIARVHAQNIAQQEFSTLSDGQRQRIMLARAICQQPQVIVLDEPTAYLDIRHKIELLDILREMAHKNGITVIMSLHEIDLATKISDYLMCVKGDTIYAFGKPEDILEGDTINNLYDIQHGSYNLLFGSVELTKPSGNPQVFVVAGAGKGADCYRALQKHNIPFATGIIFENDVDWQLAKELSCEVFAAKAFEPIEQNIVNEAAKAMLACQCVIDAGTPTGTFNAANKQLLNLAKDKNIPVFDGWRNWQTSVEIKNDF